MQVEKTKRDAINGPIEVGFSDTHFYLNKKADPQYEVYDRIKLNNIPVYPKEVAFVRMTGSYYSPASKEYKISSNSRICNSGNYDEKGMGRFHMNCWMTFDQNGFRKDSNQYIPGYSNDGTCPYVFTKDLNGTTFKDRGEIMVALEGKESEKIQLILKNGKRIMIPSTNPLLNKDDDKYLVLEKCQETTLFFKIPDNLDIKKVYIVNKGYYDML